MRHSENNAAAADGDNDVYTTTKKPMYVHYLVQLHFYDSHSISYLCFIMYSNKTVTTYMSHITLPSTRVFFCKLAFLFSVGSTVCTKTISLIFAPISII